MDKKYTANITGVIILIHPIMGNTSDRRIANPLSVIRIISHAPANT
jgi:hypothetical protein